MFLTQFFLQNTHFLLNVFSAFVLFSVSWLYFDAWREVKQKKELFKIAGFLSLSLSFLVHGVYIEQSVISGLIIDSSTINLLASILGLAGYCLIMIGLLIDPIQSRPAATQSISAFILLPTSITFISILLGFSPILSLVVFILYLRRSTIGLENHLKPLTFGFLFIFFYNLLSLSTLFEKTNNINAYNIVRPFGFLWLSTHLILLIGILIIAKWVFRYLLKRLQTQMFMILNALIMFIFMLVTVTFTSLLVKNFQENALSGLDTDVRVVQYAIEAKQSGVISDAQVISQNTQLQSAIEENNKETLKNISTSILIAKKQSYLIIADSLGTVLMRGEDSDRVGGSISSDPLFVKAARGERASSIVTIDGAIAPKLSIRSAVPVVASDKTIGVVIIGTDIDNAFVDGLKKTTKLNFSVYGGNALSATTFVATDGKSRYIGVKEQDESVNKNVINEGKNYPAEITILNVPYYGVFSPLKDVNGNPVGMIFAGKEQTTILRDASRSIEITFTIAVILILISILPIFYISKYIANQFK